MSDYAFPRSPSLGQLLFAAFMQATLTQFAKLAAEKMVEELVERPRPVRRRRRNLR